jgi:hypothetical protein
MKSRCVVAVALLVLLSTYVHAGSAPKRDNFGDAFKSARDNQILHPESIRNRECIKGVDGPGVQRAYMGYIGTFGGPPKKSGSENSFQLLPVVSAPSGTK